MVAGACITKTAKLPGKQVATITMEVGVQNTTLAFGIAMTLLDSFMIAIPAMIYALWVYVAAGITITCSRRLLANEIPASVTAAEYG